MAPGPVSLTWAPGERLLASAGAAPSCSVEALPALPRPFLNMFFSGHLTFLDRISPSEKSQIYRAMILDCRSALEKDRDSVKDEYYEVLSHAHTVWHFIEAIYLTDHSLDNRHVSHFLAEWFIINFPEFTERSKNIAYRLEGERPRDDDEEFWGYLVKLAIVGKLAKVNELLSAGKHEDEEENTKWHSKESDDNINTPEDRISREPAPVVDMMQKVIQTAPMNNISTRSDGSWEGWQSKCALWADSVELDDHPGAQRLMGLLSGEIEKISKACTTWEEMLIACTLYGRFGFGAGGNLRGGIPLVSNACASASAVYKAAGTIAGGALVEAALGNVNNAIMHMDASLPSSWFSAHLCDVLIKAGQMTDVEAARWDSEKRPTGMREFYLKQFARGLERYRGCWRLAVDYYSACPSHGSSNLIDLLSRVAYEGPNDPTAEKVLLVCKKRRLSKTARNICEQLGASCLDERNLGGAMAWFARGGLHKRAEGVAELALKKAERQGAASQAARSLECVVTSMTNMGDEKLREYFDYMRVYSELQTSLLLLSSQQVENVPKQYKDFVALARRLVGGGGLPRRFWIVVAYEAARVLELYPEHASIFTRPAINEILGALQLASGPHTSAEMLLGLRGRLAYDASASGRTQDGELSSTDDAESALSHCRGIFMSSVAKRILAK